MPNKFSLARLSSSAAVMRRRHEHDVREKAADSNAPRIVVGVCAMEKKAQSKPMRAILKRMNQANEFDLVMFGDEVILNKPIEEWPACDALLCWQSQGFPIKKAQDYVALKKPFVVNDVFKQDLLLDRRTVYTTLTDANIPTPNHIIVSRTPEEVEAQENPEGFEETHDYVSMNGVKIFKPFVEKPSDGDNHNVWIYYPHSMGGGVKTMFRKVGNKSADYLPEHPGTVRRDGSYIYEEFIATGGTDVKVYTVGARYAHAEARKSPVVDGKVQRTVDGKEVRYPVLLTPQEKEIACAVVTAFKQKVCGFDLLRTDTGKSYVCDVNGWSFVKSSKKYYDDAAGLLRQFILQALAPHRLYAYPHLPQALHDDDLPNTMSPNDEAEREEEEKVLPDLTDLEAELQHTNSASASEELRCVLAVVRHGDRTPKQKMKFKVSHATFLDLFEQYKDGKGKQAKLKAPEELEAFLNAVRQVGQELWEGGAEEGGTRSEAGAAAASVSSAGRLPSMNGDSPTDTMHLNDELKLPSRLRIVRTVLEHGNHFSGINRKVQLKPTAHEPDGGGVAELQVIVKWGGVLTHLGRQQAEDLGYIYRMVMYPQTGETGGLLRLHSTYRHDFKIYSSDEGRVQTSAAAFAKGLLDLEGSSLTPILVSLVKKDAAMLDAFGKGASQDISWSKRHLYRTLTRDSNSGEAHCVEPQRETQITPPESPKQHSTHCSDSGEAESSDDGQITIPHLPDNPLQTLHRLYAAIKELTAAIRKRLYKDGFTSEKPRFYSALNTDPLDFEQETDQPYGSETMLMMFDRWRKLEKAFYNDKEDVFDISKVPDIYDSIKFDCIHNMHLNLDSELQAVFPLAKALADCVIRAEYGITRAFKLRIAKKVATELIGKLLLDFYNVRNESFEVEQDLRARSVAATSSENSMPLVRTPGDPTSPTLGAGGSAGVSSGVEDGNEVRGGDADVFRLQTLQEEGEELGEEAEEEEELEQRVHRLDAGLANDINSPLRHVRTRIYFTSESHIHTLVNILSLGADELLRESGKQLLRDTKEFDYLTQIVFRMYENKKVPANSPARFRVEIQFSNGANYDPLTSTMQRCTLPRQFVHKGSGVTLDQFAAIMSRWGVERQPTTPQRGPLPQFGYPV